MKSFRTQRITWATDWPVIRTTTRSPTPPPSTLPSLFCPSTLTTHSQPQPPAAAAPPPPRKTPTLLPHTPQPSSNTPRYKVCPPHLREWRRTLFPKSSTSEHKQIKPNLNPKPFPAPEVDCGLSGSLSALSMALEVNEDNAAIVCGIFFFF